MYPIESLLPIKYRPCRLVNEPMNQYERFGVVATLYQLPVAESFSSECLQVPERWIFFNDYLEVKVLHFYSDI